MKGHGGARKGAGRPRQYDFWETVTIGQACEKYWREASQTAFDARLASLRNAAEIQRLRDTANAIPVSRRKAWLNSYESEDQSGQIADYLHERAGHHLSGGFETEGETYGGDYAGDAPRVMQISTKPLRGTRKRIIGEVATESGLSEKAVDNLWQAYRRFERELLESRDSGES